MKQQKHQSPAEQQERQPQTSPQRPGQGEANSAPAAEPGSDAKKSSDAKHGNRAAQRHQKESQVAQLSAANVEQSAANVEESPHMDRGDSAAGSGESLTEGRDAAGAGESLRRGAVDTQYGTRSGMKTEAAQRAPSASPGTSESSGTRADSEPPEAPNPGSSEESSGTDRDTMSGSRPGGRA